MFPTGYIPCLKNVILASDCLIQIFHLQKSQTILDSPWPRNSCSALPKTKLRKFLLASFLAGYILPTL